MSEYKPIDCALHEQYQIAVMKHARLDLIWVDEKGDVKTALVAPKDVYTRNKAEYLLGTSTNKEEIQIRLDRIRRARWATDGSLLG